MTDRPINPKDFKDDLSLYPWNTLGTIEPVRINADNVARWFDGVGYKGFPITAPVAVSPFPHAWFEYIFPDIWATEGDVKQVRRDVDRVIVQVLCDDLTSYGPDVKVDGFSEGARWFVVMDIYIKYTSGEIDFIGSVRHEADADAAVISGSLSYGYDERIDESITDRADVLRAMVWPASLTMSLLHCKNIELIDIPVSRQQRRFAERKGKPLIQYKTLVIEPFKKQVRNEAREHGQSEIQRALHIARGHFRTYTEEKPLFGRVSGTFWIPMHLRGNKAKGEVHKDYEVRTEE